MSSEILSETLVSNEFTARLRDDIASADIVRFLVCYVTTSGLKALGRDSLTSALSNEHSFGIGSISCSCGFNALVDLQSTIGEETQRLKYFMDPHVQGKNEPDDPALLHSKLVYIAQFDGQKSVTYIGSHNWTKRALGPKGTRNGEVSMRYEEPFAEAHLEGSAESLSGRVNSHLLDANALDLCLPATRDNVSTFSEWMSVACPTKSTSDPKESITKCLVLLAVCEKDEPSVQEWMGLKRRSAYIRVSNEEDGSLLWDTHQYVIVLIWRDIASLKRADQPVLLVGDVSFMEGTKLSARHGSNLAETPIEGFRVALQRKGGADRKSAVNQRGRQVGIYDFDLLSSAGSSSQFDGDGDTFYRFQFEISHVILPANYANQLSEADDEKTLIWQPHTLAFAQSRTGAKTIKGPGYEVSAEQVEDMMQCLLRFGLNNTEMGKAVKPYSGLDKRLFGRREAIHDVHETFLQYDDEELWNSIADKSKEGVIVAVRPKDVESLPDAGHQRILFDEEEGEPLVDLPAVFTAYCRKIGNLIGEWMQR